ncbi:hypothetical protein C8J56DRAFT_1032795 [Mycena floridula]|nr:hypothetical protein C8J56DRAFT_1032795 [Mycena floridula]
MFGAPLDALIFAQADALTKTEEQKEATEQRTVRMKESGDAIRNASLARSRKSAAKPKETDAPVVILSSSPPRSPGSHFVPTPVSSPLPRYHMFGLANSDTESLVSSQGNAPTEIVSPVLSPFRLPEGFGMLTGDGLQQLSASPSFPEASAIGADAPCILIPSHLKTASAPIPPAAAPAVLKRKRDQENSKPITVLSLPT